MSNTLKSIVILLAAVALVVVITLRPFSTDRKDYIQVRAIVTKVSVGGLHDIVISLHNIRGIHYISKNNTNGLTAAILSERLVNKEVLLSYMNPGALSKFAPGTEKRKITEIRLGKELIYSDSE